MIAASFAGVAWLGAALIVISDGRRGLALGLGGIAIGLAGLGWRAGETAAAGVILAGGLAAAALQLRRGRPGWMVMPPGSSPRVILAGVGGLVALWIGSSAGGSAAPFMVAVLAVLFLAGARIIQGSERAVALAAVAALALMAGAAGGFASGALVTPIAAALAAAASGVIPTPVTDGG